MARNWLAQLSSIFKVAIYIYIYVCINMKEIWNLIGASKGGSQEEGCTISLTGFPREDSLISHMWGHHGPPWWTMLCYAKSLQSCPTLCDPIDGSHQGPLSLGFSRQEHWSGLPFPSPMHESEKCKWSRSVVSDTHIDIYDVMLFPYCELNVHK